MRTRWLEGLTLGAAAALLVAVGWCLARARFVPAAADRGNRADWAESLCATDAECEELEGRLVELGWIPPEPMFEGDRRR